MDPIDRLKEVWRTRITEVVNERSCSVYADEGDLTCRLIRLLDFRENGPFESHSHFNGTFAYRSSKGKPSRFVGSLKEAVDEFVPWWERAGKPRYAFTVDILTHRTCSNSVPSELGVEVKFHRTWTSGMSPRRVREDLEKLTQLRMKGVMRETAFVNVYSPNNPAGQKGLDALNKILDDYQEVDPKLTILRYADVANLGR